MLQCQGTSYPKELWSALYIAFQQQQKHRWWTVVNAVNTQAKTWNRPCWSGIVIPWSCVSVSADTTNPTLPSRFSTNQSCEERQVMFPNAQSISCVTLVTSVADYGNAKRPHRTVCKCCLGGSYNIWHIASHVKSPMHHTHTLVTKYISSRLPWHSGRCPIFHLQNWCPDLRVFCGQLQQVNSGTEETLIVSKQLRLGVISRLLCI